MARRRRASFSVESLREEVEEEFNNSDIGLIIEGEIRSVDLKQAASVSPDVVLFALIAKFGMALTAGVASIASPLLLLPSELALQALKMLCPQLGGDEVGSIFHCLERLKVAFPKCLRVDNPGSEFYVFSPPCGTCLSCHNDLVRHNNPVMVDFYHLRGHTKAVKVSLKCNRCGISYGYSKYGNRGSGWNLYPMPRDAVEASDVCFVQRSLLRWQISLT